MHGLLKRQIKRYFGDNYSFHNDCKEFIEAVNNAYKEFDIDREMAERSLELSSQELLDANLQMRTIFLAIPDLVFRLNCDGTILEFKGGSAGDFLIDSNDMIGKNIFKGPIKELNKLFLSAIEKVKLTGQIERIEYTIPAPGQKKFYEARVLPLSEEQLIVIIRNITVDKNAQEALKDSEQQMRLLLENSIDGILLTIPDGTILTMNAAANDMFGYSEVELKEIGKSGVIDATDSRFSKALDERLKTGKFRGELTGIRKDGTKFPMEISTSLFNDHNGNPRSSMIIRDISKRKLAENELRKLSEAVEQSPASIVITDIKGNIEYVNRTFSENTGYLFADVINKNAKILASGYTARSEYKKLWDTITSGSSWSGEFLNKKKNGELLWEDVIISPIKDKNGEIINFLAVKTDITQRKKSEKEIRMLAHSIASISESVTITDEHNNIIFVNEAFLATYGYSKEELLGKNINIVRTENFIESSFKEALTEKSEGNWCGEVINKKKDGSSFPVLLSTSIVKDDNGQPIALISVASDITKRKKTEEELLRLNLIQSLILENSSLGIAFIRNRVCEWVNTRACELFKIPIEDLKGAPTRVIYPSDEVYKQIEREAYPVIASGERSDNTIQLQRSDGTLFWCRLIGKALIPSKPADGSIWMFEDITDKMLDESRRAVSQKLESIGQLAAGIAHEINTPMQYIDNNTSFLKDSILSLSTYIYSLQQLVRNSDRVDASLIEKQIAELENQYELGYLLEEIPKAIEQTGSGISRITNIVKAMKDFAHPGKKEKSYYNINRGIEVTSTIAHNEWKYVAELELNLSDKLPPVYCLQDELNQVILNMIINATHAIEEKNGKNSPVKGKITIDTFQEKDFAVIKITDTGMGIKKEHRDRIFDPFFTTKEVGKGTGQGLSISHDVITNKHNGTITVESELGIGTTFTIKIPVNKNE
jgi:two-component system, NtrC family, sensor kinase